MSDTPVLQSGDLIHILVEARMSADRISAIKEMYETRGIKVVGVTLISGGTFQIASIIRGKDPVGMMAKMQPRVR